MFQLFNIIHFNKQYEMCITSVPACRDTRHAETDLQLNPANLRSREIIVITLEYYYYIAIALPGKLSFSQITKILVML